MLNCRDATRRMSDALEGQLSRWERLGLRMHVVLCGACRRYRRQMQGVENLLRGCRTSRRDATAPAEGEALRLSAARREAIKRSLAGGPPEDGGTAPQAATENDL